MRWVLVILGIVVIALGVLWILQGTGVVSLGQMAGHRRWIVIGAGLDVVGVILLIIGSRMKRTTA